MKIVPRIERKKIPRYYIAFNNCSGKPHESPCSIPIYMLNVLPLTFAEIRIKGKAAVQPLMEKWLFAFREDTHWKMMTLCALCRDAAAFIDALGTIHFWELRVRRFYTVITQKCYGRAGNPAASLGLHPLNAAEEQMKLSWRLGGEKKLWDCFHLAESENLKALGTEGTQREMNLAWELGAGVCRSNQPLRLHQKFQQCGTPTACACAIQCFVSLKYHEHPMFVNFQNSNLKLHVWLIFKTARRAM